MTIPREFPISLTNPLLTHRLQNLKRSCIVQIESQSQQYFSLHRLQLRERITRISHLNVVLHSRRIDFFVFAGDPQTGNSNQLVLMLGDLILRNILVKVSQSQIKSLLLQLKRLVYINQPVDQDMPHVRSDIGHQFLFLLLLNKTSGTCKESIKAKIYCSYSVKGSLISSGIFLSKDLDFCLCSNMRTFFSEIECTLDLRYRLVISLPKVRLEPGPFLNLPSI